METKTIRVAGLSNESAAQQVEHALHEVWGIRSVEEISLARGEVTFCYDEKAASFGDFQRALQESGFAVSGGATDA